MTGWRNMGRTLHECTLRIALSAFSQRLCFQVANTLWPLMRKAILLNPLAWQVGIPREAVNHQSCVSGDWRGSDSLGGALPFLISAVWFITTYLEVQNYLSKHRANPLHSPTDTPGFRWTRKVFCRGPDCKFVRLYCSRGLCWVCLALQWSLNTVLALDHV